jgi:hypothetical protein
MLNQEIATLKLTHPQIPWNTQCESKSGNNGRNWGTFSSSQHFEGKRDVSELWDGD